MIPKIIYKTGPFLEDELPEEINLIFEKTLKDNPGCELIYFNDQDCREFLIKNFNTEILNAYDSLVPSAYKADLFRYCLLYQSGGIWSDLTQTFIEPIDTFIDFEEDDLILVDGGFIPCAQKKGIEIAFMAAKPRHDIYLSAINQVIQNVNFRYYGCSSFNPTGPIMFKELVESNKTKYKLDFVFKRLDNESVNEDFIYYKNKPIIKTRSINHGTYLYHNTNKIHYSILHRNKKIYK